MAIATILVTSFAPAETLTVVRTAADICGNRRSIVTDAFVLEAKCEFSFLTGNLMVTLSPQV